MSLRAIYYLGKLGIVAIGWNKKRRIKKVLQQRGLTEHLIKLTLYAIDYASWSEERKEYIFKTNHMYTREEWEYELSNSIIKMLSFEEVAKLVIGNKKKALEAHQWAVNQLKEANP